MAVEVDVVETWDEYALEGIEKVREGMQCTTNMWADFTSSLPVLPDGAWSLDIGTGDGYIPEQRLNQNPNAHIDAIDISPNFLEKARQRLARFGERVRLFYGDATEALPQPMQKYTDATASFMVQYVTNADKMKLFSRVHDSLQDGGNFYFNTFYKGVSLSPFVRHEMQSDPNLMTRLASIMPLAKKLDTHDARGQMEKPTREELEWMLNQTGFTASFQEYTTADWRYTIPGVPERFGAVVTATKIPQATWTGLAVN